MSNTRDLDDVKYEFVKQIKAATKNALIEVQQYATVASTRPTPESSYDVHVFDSTAKIFSETDAVRHGRAMREVASAFTTEINRTVSAKLTEIEAAESIEECEKLKDAVLEYLETRPKQFESKLTDKIAELKAAEAKPASVGKIVIDNMIATQTEVVNGALAKLSKFRDAAIQFNGTLNEADIKKIDQAFAEQKKYIEETYLPPFKNSALPTARGQTLDALIEEPISKFQERINEIVYANTNKERANNDQLIKNNIIALITQEKDKVSESEPAKDAYQDLLDRLQNPTFKGSLTSIIRAWQTENESKLEKLSDRMHQDLDKFVQKLKNIATGRIKIQEAAPEQSPVKRNQGPRM